MFKSMTYRFKRLHFFLAQETAVLMGSSCIDYTESSLPSIPDYLLDGLQMCRCPQLMHCPNKLLVFLFKYEVCVNSKARKMISVKITPFKMYNGVTLSCKMIVTIKLVSIPIVSHCYISLVCGENFSNLLIAALK